MKRATKLDDMLMSFQDEALFGSDFDNFFVNTASARGKDVIRQLVYIFNINKEYNKKILFGGHLGCGKTTELYRAERLLSNDYLVVPFSVKLELDPNKMEYVDLLFAILNKVVEAAQKENIKIKTGVVDNVISYWKNETFIKYTSDLSYDIEASVDAKVNWLSAFVAKVKASFKVGGKIREETKEVVESNLRTLILSINEIVEGINDQLKEKNKKILVIVEDLEKLSLSKCKDLFIENRNALIAIDLDIIYTFPISLYYSEYFNEISADFYDNIILSMIKVKEINGNECTEGIECLKQIVEKRCDLNLFDERVLSFLIEKSGGSIRDLFTMIIQSVISIRSDEQFDCIDKITMDVAKTQYNNIVSIKQRSLKEEQIPFLVELYKSEEKKPIENKNNDLICLLQSMNIIEYNGTRWCDLHPATCDFLKSAKYITR